MEAAVGVFHHLKAGLLRDEDVEEFPSEYSDDYNVSSASQASSRNVKILGKGSRRSVSCQQLPSSPVLMSQVSVRRKVFIEDEEEGILLGRGDSGFNSERESSGVSVGVYSDCLDHYGLDGPLVPAVEDVSSHQDSIRSHEDDKPSEVDFREEAPSVTSTTARKRKEKEVKQATIRQHYYPEGGWGYIVLITASLVNILAHGLQLSFTIISLAIDKRWGAHNIVPACSVGALSVCVSLLMSPLTVAICKRKSTRITAVVGGLVISLGCLFTSFASQFHQIIFSYGIVLGVGVSFVRDTATLMVGQYFKRKREGVEMVLVSASGLGLTVMSHFLKTSIRDIGWRLGLQAVTGALASTFILGTFYRSATLYHPQRRAILHLKSQKRKIKDKNKKPEDKLPFFDFSCLKSRSLQIILVSSSITSLGLLTPFLILIQDTDKETEIGLAWAGGVTLACLLTLSSALPLRHSRQHLTALSGLGMGVSLLCHAHTQHWTWLWGLTAGAYHYSLKMFVFQKVRARNFARAWALVHAAQSVSVLVGVSLASLLSPGDGHTLAGLSIIAGSLSLFLLNVHRWRLKQRKISKRLARMRSNKSDLTIEDTVSEHPLEPGSVHKPERRPSFPEEEDVEELIVGGVSIHKLEDAGELIEGMEYDMMEGVMEDGEFMDYNCGDNITSCNVVDNYLMLDEYEQNLCKEHEAPTSVASSVTRRLRKWSLVRQGTSLVQEASNRKRSVNNNVMAGTSFHTNKRAITTIQEDEP